MNGKIKTKFAALFAVALMITVCVVPVVGNEDVQAADVSSTIPEGISDIEIQFFTEDSTDFSDMIYSANGSKLPASVDPVEWKQVENGSVYINVNKDSEYFGKFLRFGQTGLSNEEIVKIAKAGGQLPLIQTSWMYSDAVDVDIFVNGVEKDGGAPSLTKAGATFDEAEAVSSIRFIGSNVGGSAGLGFAADLSNATGDYKVEVKVGSAVIASEKFSFESDADLLSVTGTVKNKNGTGIKGAKVAYTVDGNAGTYVTKNNGSYDIKFKSGSVVAITGITYDGGAYTFDGGYVFGTITEDKTKDFTANENAGTVTVSSANSAGIKGASITLSWYYQYQTTGGDPAVTTYNISTSAPQGITAGTVKVLGPADDEGKIHFTYTAPSGSLTATGQSNFSYVLINTSVPNATGYTFTQVTLPQTTTDSTKALSAWNAGSYSTTTGTCNMSSGAGSLTAKEMRGSITVDSKNDSLINGATVNLSWYYEYQTTSNSQITYNISTSAPQGITAGTVSVLGASDDNGKIYFTYTAPSGSLTTDGQSNFSYVLINNSMPSATGYTFTQVTLPQTTTDSTKALSAWNAGSYSTTTGTCNMSSGTGYLVAKENSYLIQGTVSAPGIVADSKGKVPELTVSYTNGIGSSVKVDVLTSGVYAYKFYAIEGKSCVITPTLNGYTFTPSSFTTNSAGAAITVPVFVGKSTAEVTKFVDTTVLTPELTVSGNALAPGANGKSVIVDLTYDVNGKQYTTPVKVVSTGTVGSEVYSATFDVAGIAGTYVELISATAAGKQIAYVNGNWTATSTQIKTFYLFDGEENIPVANLTLDLYYGATSIGSITSGSDGFATLEVDSTYNTAGSYKGILNGKYKMTFEPGVDVYAEYVIGDVSEIIGKNLVPVKVGYFAAYNNSEDFVDAVQIAGVNAVMYSAELGSTVDLKAPSIDGFEFVAWMIGGVVVSEDANYTLEVDKSYAVEALYSAVHYEEPAEGLSMNVLVIGIVILILGILAVAYGIISKKQ